MTVVEAAKHNLEEMRRVDPKELESILSDLRSQPSKMLLGALVVGSRGSRAEGFASQLAISALICVLDERRHERTIQIFFEQAEKLISIEAVEYEAAEIDPTIN